MDINLHDTTNNPPKAEAGKSGTTAWFSIRQGDNEITIFAREHQADAIRMIADVFNDAFQPKAETPPAAPAAIPADDDMPF